MPTISLTNFVDFVIKSGNTKLTQVKRIKKQHEMEYSPATDFWKGLREGIIDFHKKKAADKKFLDKIAAKQSEKRGRLYLNRISAYKKFLGRKEVVWFQPPSAQWSKFGLIVNINPELGIYINGIPHVIKLYFKEPPLSKSKVDTILHLMGDTLKAKPRNSIMSILDVPRSKLLTPTKNIAGLNILLSGEARSFLTIWEQI